jgi:signal transduction histidine kinase
MNRSGSLKRILVIWSCFLSVFAFSFLLSVSAREAAQNNPPIVENGLLDLRDWDFSAKGPVSLTGKWEFYWQQHVEPEDFQFPEPTQPTTMIKLPGFWSHIEIKGRKIGGKGFATYRLKILLKDHNENLALKTGDINTAGRLFINDKLVAESGVAGSSIDSSVPRLVPQVITFPPGSNKLDIVIHVSNFHDKEGGVPGTITLGTARQLIEIRTESLVFEFFLFGSIIIIALYHLGLYVLRRKDVSTLYFSLFCFLIALRTILTGERYLIYIASWLSWETAVKVEILTFYLAVPIFSMFIRDLFPRSFSLPVLRLIQLVSLTASLVLLFAPIQIGIESLVPFQIATLLIILYLMAIMILSIRQKQDGAIIFMLGFFVLVLTTVNDIFYTFNIVQTGFWVPFGVFVFILSQAFLLSSRFSRAFQRVKILGMELGDKTQELSQKNLELEDHKNTLEQKVHKRTEAIKVLLDNTGQGFLTFGPNYRVEHLYSKACRLFFSSPIEETNALGLISASTTSNDESGIREMLDLVFDGTSPLELFIDILPSELTVEGRVLQAEYRVIASANADSPIRIMLILTDKTKERELSEQLRRDEERKEVIVKIAMDKAGFIEFVHDMRRRFLLLSELLDKNVTSVEINSLFAVFHTIKGEAGSFALAQISEMAHGIESHLDGFRNGKQNLDTKAKSSLTRQAGEMEDTFNLILKEFEELLPEEELDSKERFYQISDSKMAELAAYLHTIVSKEQHKQLKNKLEVICRQPIAPIFRHYRKIAEELATKLDKEIKVILTGMDVEIDMKRFDDLLVILVHLIRNCVDHGLEEPVIRSMAEKSLEGILSIGAVEKKDQVILSISDDGQGMDPKLIKRQAVTKRLITEEEAEGLNEEQSLLLIFEPGFSTVKQLSYVSGRGVGMGAVKTSVEQARGSIAVHTRIGKGTSFTITLPRNS